MGVISSQPFTPLFVKILENIWYGDCQKAVKTQNNLAKNCRKRAGFNSSLWERISKGAIGQGQGGGILCRLSV